jgi:hypothetical protein
VKPTELNVVILLRRVGVIMFKVKETEVLWFDSGFMMTGGTSPEKLRLGMLCYQAALGTNSAMGWCSVFLRSHSPTIFFCGEG